MKPTIQILSSLASRLALPCVFFLADLVGLTVSKPARAKSPITNYGYSAGGFNPGQNNSAFGFQAHAFFVIGDQNTAVGSGALSGGFDSAGEPNSSGNDNTAIGAQALFSDRAGSYNTASGRQALASNQDGNYNVANGWRALQSNAS